MADDKEARVPAHDQPATDDGDDGLQREGDAGVSPHGRAHWRRPLLGASVAPRDAQQADCIFAKTDGTWGDTSTGTTHRAPAKSTELACDTVGAEKATSTRQDQEVGSGCSHPEDSLQHGGNAKMCWERRQPARQPNR